MTTNAHRIERILWRASGPGRLESLQRTMPAIGDDLPEKKRIAECIEGAATALKDQNWQALDGWLSDAEKWRLRALVHHERATRKTGPSAGGKAKANNERDVLAARNRRIAKMHQCGMAPKEIAPEFDLSPDRVRAILRITKMGA